MLPVLCSKTYLTILPIKFYILDRGAVRLQTKGLTLIKEQLPILNITSVTREQLAMGVIYANHKELFTELDR